MAKEKEQSQSVFDVNTVRQLIELMREHELTEIDLRELDQRIRLRRGNDPVIVQGGVPSGQVMAMAAPSPAPSSPAAASAPVPAAAPVVEGVFIRSPTIGTFYSSSKPGSPAFVKVGDVVTPETVVCVVEAMKMFNEIQAGISGKIVEVLVKNEEPVDNNKALFRVLPL
jgi:acetyl-CoA carboxylase biotin carboxyl carrier protein